MCTSFFFFFLLSMGQVTEVSCNIQEVSRAQSTVCLVARKSVLIRNETITRVFFFFSCFFFHFFTDNYQQTCVRLQETKESSLSCYASECGSNKPCLAYTLCLTYYIYLTLMLGWLSTRLLILRRF